MDSSPKFLLFRVCYSTISTRRKRKKKWDLSNHAKTADYWVLVIATNTFLILGDQKRAAAWVQDYWIVLWLLPWGLSILWASLGLAITGYGDIGACEWAYWSLFLGTCSYVGRKYRVLVYQWSYPATRELHSAVGHHSIDLGHLHPTILHHIQSPSGHGFGRGSIRGTKRDANWIRSDRKTIKERYAHRYENQDSRRCKSIEKGTNKPSSLILRPTSLRISPGFLSHDAIPTCLHVHLDNPYFNPDIPRNWRRTNTFISQYSW